jgi:hypothetical protein
MSAPDREPVIKPFEALVFTVVTAGLLLIAALEHFGWV